MSVGQPFTPPRRSTGFTLLEVIVVITVIGVITTLATLSLGNDGRRPELEDVANRLRLIAEVGAQESVLWGRPVGLRVARDHYQLLAYETRAWVAKPDDALYRLRVLPSGISLQVRDQDSLAHQQDATAPQLVFLPDGESRLRTLALGADTSPDAVVLVPGGHGLELEAAP